MLQWPLEGHGDEPWQIKKTNFDTPIMKIPKIRLYALPDYVIAVSQVEKMFQANSACKL